MSEEAQQNSTPGVEKNIGRRTFIGLMVAGIAALFLGKEILPSVTTGGSTGTTTAGGASAPGAASGGKSPVAGFRINSVNPAPAFDPATWKLTFDGLVGTPLAFTWAQFTALPQTTVVRDFYCVEGWGVDGVTWVGVSMKELMQRAQVGSDATHLVFHSGDGVYADILSLEQAALEDVLLAHNVNGVLLPPDMGQPVRLTYPGHDGYKYVKWVERVEAIDRKKQSFQGYWEGYGYPESG